MTTVPTDALVVFQVGEQQVAMSVAAVERVVQAVEIAPLPDAPRGVRGVINLQGRIVPVFELWSRLGLPSREVRSSDHLVVSRTHWRTVALLVDSVVDVVRRSDAPVTPSAEILRDIELISGVMKLGDSLALVHDIERFLSIEDHGKLQLALNLEP
jgi:purine-binding chemotaxis protein CheW